MDILLTYKILDKNEVLSFKLRTDQYLDVTDTENYENTDIPIYNDAREYVSAFDKGIDVQTIEWTKLIFSNSIKSDGFIHAKYFPKNSLFLHRKDVKGFELIIQDIQVSENCVVVTRMERENSESEWKNINYSIGTNINGAEERWLNPLKGELMS